jgi:hypothetical protein
MAETPNVSNGAQVSENVRKISFLNYKSAALNQLSYAGFYEGKYSPMRLPRVFFYMARSLASRSVILDTAGAHGRLVFRETAER